MDPEPHPVVPALICWLAGGILSQRGRRLRPPPTAGALSRAPVRLRAPSAGPPASRFATQRLFATIQPALSLPTASRLLRKRRPPGGACALWALRTACQPGCSEGWLLPGWALGLGACAAGGLAAYWLVGQRVAGSLLSSAVVTPALVACALALLWPKLEGDQPSLAGAGTLHLERLWRIMERASAQEGADEIAQSALDDICQQLNAPTGFVALRDETGTLVVRSASSSSSLRVGDVVPLPAMPRFSLPVRARRAFNGEPVALLFPLGTSCGEHGLLGLGPPAGDAFSELDLHFLASVAGQLSLAIENAQLRRRLEGNAPAFPFQANASWHPAARSAPGDAHIAVTARCLGEFALTLGDRRLPDEAWGGRSSGHRHAKAVFAFLLANRERTVGRDEIIEVVWGDSADLSALENRLDRTVCALRRALEPDLQKGSRSTYIFSEVGGYRLNSGLAWRVDAEEFTALLAEARGLAREGHLEAALSHNLQAVALYRGDYLADCPFVDRSHLVNMRRDALRRQYLEALLSIAGLYWDLGRPEGQLSHLHRAVQEDDFNERAYRALVAAYVEQGRQAEAMRLCRHHRARLATAELSCSGRCFADPLSGDP